MNMNMKKITICAALILSASSAFSMTYFLTAQWYENGSHMCKYGNGSVLSVGANVCPLSIEG